MKKRKEKYRGFLGNQYYVFRYTVR